MNCTFEPMAPDHEHEVMDIFNYYAEHTLYAYPEGRVPDQFYARFLEIARVYPGYVIKNDSEVIGFCLLRPYNPFPVFNETAQFSCFIKKEYTGKGVGSLALAELGKAALERGIKRLLSDISSENEDSIRFHLKEGFNRCGLFKNAGKKFNRSFDVVWMEKEL